jgi:integrase
MARSQQTPLATALESFLRARWDLKPRTKLTYAKSIRRFMPVHNVIGELTADNVNDFLAANANHRTMARNDAIALRQLAQWAVKAGIFPLNPLATVELPKGHGTRRKPFTDAEVQVIIKTAAESRTGLRDQAIVVLGLATALRPAELWQLQLSDVDLRSGWVSVRLATTKTEAGARDVPLDPQVIALLDSYIHDIRGVGEGPLFSMLAVRRSRSGASLRSTPDSAIVYVRRASTASWPTAPVIPASRTGSDRGSKRRSCSSSRGTSRSSRPSCTSAV